MGNINLHLDLCMEETRRILDITAKNVVQLLVNKNIHITTAESCTGGLISSILTDHSGVSEVFELGVCSYSNDIKNKILGVPLEELKKYGAVSSQVAISMANGVRKLSGADIGVSVTGIAGPGGGTALKPVGTVYIAISTTDFFSSYLLKLNNLEDKSRKNIRFHTALCVLEMVQNYLNNN